MLEHDGVAFFTAICGVVCGYFLNIYKTRLNYSRETEVNERDLLQRIDSLQQQMIDMAKENASLKSEVKSLRNEIRELRRKNEQITQFCGEDYSAGALD